MSKPIVMERGVKYRDADKMALIPVKNVATEREALLRKPEWMKIKLPADSTRIGASKPQCAKMACILSARKPPALTWRNALTTALQRL